jgi:hypothetical protein
VRTGERVERGHPPPKPRERQRCAARDPRIEGRRSSELARGRLADLDALGIAPQSARRVRRLDRLNQNDLAR